MSQAYEVFVIKPGEPGVMPAVSHDSFADAASARRYARAAPFKGFGIKIYKTRRDRRGKLIDSELIFRKK